MTILTSLFLEGLCDNISNVHNLTFFSDMDVGKIGCMKELGITESFVVKRQVLLSAVEAAEMILRVDSIITSAPRKRTEDRGHC